MSSDCIREQRIARTQLLGGPELSENGRTVTTTSASQRAAVPQNGRTVTHGVSRLEGQNYSTRKCGHGVSHPEAQNYRKMA